MRALPLAVLALSVASARPGLAEPEPEPGVEVVVEGHRSTRPAREPTVAASRIDASELGRPGVSAAAILSHVPGVQVSETGGAADFATASVRGASSAQTPVYLASVRLNDDVTGSADLSLVPLWMLSRAEVYRGNAPADADHLGIGGAVYFEPRLPRATRRGAGLELGSFAQRGGFVAAEVAQHGDGALVAFHESAARNDYPYRDNGGTSDRADDRAQKRPNADYVERDAWAVGRTTLGRRARVTIVFNGFEREQGITGLAAVPALAARSESARVLAGLSARVACGSQPNCELALTSQALSARSRLSDPRRELGLPSERLDSKGTRVAERARLSLSGRVFRAMLGADVELERLALDGARNVENGSASGTLRASRRTASARAALSAFPALDTELSALGLVTCDATRGPSEAQGCAASTPEGRLGLRQRFGAFELRSNFGRYARVPTLGELYGVSAMVRGNSALRPEQGLALDFGARWAAQFGPVGTYLDAFGFARGVSQLIAYRRSSLGALRPYNVGNARVLGAELEAGADWGRHARAVIAVTLLDPRDTTPGRNLVNDLVPYQSRFSGTAFVEAFTDFTARSLRRAGLDARLAHRGSRLADPAGLLVLPASTELDLGATVSFGVDPQLSLRVAVDDVFDDRHFDFIGYPVPGRRVHAALEAWW